jgi:hypothetical protein
MLLPATLPAAVKLYGMGEFAGMNVSNPNAKIGTELTILGYKGKNRVANLSKDGENVHGQIWYANAECNIQGARYNVNLIAGWNWTYVIGQNITTSPTSVVTWKVSRTN